MVPIHWGMFDLALHTWHDPIVRVTNQARKKGVTTIAPKLGQLVSTQQNCVMEDWWSETVHKVVAPARSRGVPLLKKNT